LDVFADTMEVLAQSKRKYRILIVGRGPARAWFENQLPDAVFAGFQSGADLGRAAASMDILFNPSTTETFGNVTLEAMASGVPVVAARAAGSESLVKDKKTGLLATPGAFKDFAAALGHYIDDPSLRKAHGTAGEKLSRNFNWDSINQSVADTYLKIIAKHQG